jgi:hypothetical protein
LALVPVVREDDGRPKTAIGPSAVLILLCIALRQDAKSATFGIIFFLCGLCAFAGNIPAFGGGSAAPN